MVIFVYEYTCAQNAASLPGSLCAEGRAMLAMLVEDVEHSGSARAVTLLHASQPGNFGAHCRRIETEAEEGVFGELAHHADFTWAIAPEFDNLLATRWRWTHTAGGRWLGPTLSALELTADKLALSEHLRRQGVPTPKCQNAVTAITPLFPVVCKPRYGAGSQATFLIHDAATLAALLAEPAVLDQSLLGEPLLQPFVPGIPASAAFLMGPRQTLPLPPALQHLSSDGRFRYLGGQVPVPEPLAPRAQALARRAVAAVPGLLGYVGVDLILGDAPDGSADVVLEINPRLTTSYLGLRTLCQDNLAGALLRLQQGDTVPPLCWQPGGVRFSVDGTVRPM